MADDADPNDDLGSGKADSFAQIVRFPQSRVSPAGSSEPFRELGMSTLSKSLGLPERQATGHWCSRCRGICSDICLRYLARLVEIVTVSATDSDVAIGLYPSVMEVILPFNWGSLGRRGSLPEQTA